jgi:hypothetical protein
VGNWLGIVMLCLAMSTLYALGGEKVSGTSGKKEGGEGEHDDPDDDNDGWCLLVQQTPRGSTPRFRHLQPERISKPGDLLGSKGKWSMIK